MAITKAHIIESIQAQLGSTKKQSTECVETVLQILKETLASGEDILIPGFGKFKVNSKDRRKGRNPATGDSLMLPPRKVVTFRPSVKLKQKLNGNE